MLRVKRSGRARIMLIISSATCAFGVACSVFSLGDVVPADDGGATSGDGAALDGNATDGDVADSARGPCVDGGDPCNCVPAPLTISQQGYTSPEALIVSGGTVFFMISESATGANPVVYAAPIDGLGDAAPLQLTPPSTISFGDTMALGGDKWIFIRRTDASHLGIDRVSVDGGTVDASYFPVPRSPGLHLVTNSNDVFFASDLGSVCALPFEGAMPMVDPSDSGCGAPPLGDPRFGGPSDEPLFATDQNVFASSSLKVFSMPIAGGTLAQITQSTPPGVVSSLIENGGSLFWSNVVTADSGTIWSANDDGSGTKMIVASPFEGRIEAAVIAVDSSGIWWSNSTEKKIWSAARDGSNVHVVACEPGSVPFLTTDATYVYWMTSNGSIRRAPK